MLQRFRDAVRAYGKGYSQTYVRPSLVETFRAIRGGAGSLPINIQPGDPGHIGHHDSIHELLAALASQTGFVATGYQQGTLASRPGASGANEGMFWFATDTLALYYSTGGVWFDIGAGGGGGGSSPFYFPESYDPAAGPGGTPAQNLAALQAAADDAEAAGGGIVFVGPGTWGVASTALGVFLGHGVELLGSGLGATILEMDDPNTGLNNGGLIRGRPHSTTGDMTAGSRVLQVASAAGWRVGGVVQVLGAGPPSTVQPLQDEPLYARIDSISGLNVTLDRPAVQTVNGAIVRHGSRGVVLRNITFDGNRPALADAGGSAGPLISSDAGADWLVHHCEITHAARTALAFSLGQQNSWVDKCMLRDNNANNNGVELGFGVVFFQGPEDCGIRDTQFKGDHTVPIGIDDRTTTTSTSDKEPKGCHVIDNTIEFDPDLVLGNNVGTGILISGTSGNVVRGNVIRNAARPIFIVPTQGATPLPVRSNIVTNNVLEDCDAGVQLGGLANDDALNNVIAFNVARGTTPAPVTNLLVNTTNVIFGNYHEDNLYGLAAAESGLRTDYFIGAPPLAGPQELDARIIVQGNYFLSRPIRGNTLGGLTCVFANDGIGTVEAGDILLVFVSWTGDTLATLPTPTPSGYTKEEEVLSGAIAGSVGGVLFSKVAAGGEASVTVNPLPANSNNGATMQVIRFPAASVLGLDGTSQTALQTSIASAYNVDGLTTTQPDAQVFYFISAVATSERSFATSVRELWDFGNDPGRASSQAGQVKTQASPGASGQEVFVGSSGGFNAVGIAVAVAPSAPGGDEGPVQLIYYGGGQRFRLVGVPD